MVKEEKAKEHPADERFRMMVQQVKDYGMFMLDPQGQVLSWNAGAELVLGYSADEIIGKSIALFYTREEVKEGKPERELELARGAGNVELQGWRVRKDGSRFWAVVNTTAFYDNGGNLLGFCKITRDYTERRGMEDALQKSRNMFEKLFETSPDAIVVVDSGGIIRRVNQQTEILFGYMREELLGTAVERLMPKRYQKPHRQYVRGYFQDPRARKMGVGLELYGLNRDGREIPVDIMLTPIETSEGTWAFAVIRDITRQRQSDTQIMELNAALKNQIEQLEASNRELEAFSYSVSHDLRAPLRHIIGFVDLLNSRGTVSQDEKSRHYMEVITEAAKKMGNLIDDLLAFSRMGRAEMMRSRVDLSALVKEIAGDLGEEHRGRVDKLGDRGAPRGGGGLGDVASGHLQSPGERREVHPPSQQGEDRGGSGRKG